MIYYNKSLNTIHIITERFFLFIIIYFVYAYYSRTPLVWYYVASLIVVYKLYTRVQAPQGQQLYCI